MPHFIAECTANLEQEGDIPGLLKKRYLALSLELVELSEAGTYKHNNAHARFKKA